MPYPSAYLLAVAPKADFKSDTAARRSIETAKNESDSHFFAVGISLAEPAKGDPNLKPASELSAVTCLQWRPHVKIKPAASKLAPANA